MLKRWLELATICALLIAMGCSRQRSDVVTLAVGGAPAELDFWEVLIEKFEKTHGIQVDILRQPTDTDQRRQGLVISLKSRKDDPDVMLMDVAWVAQFAASGWLENLVPDRQQSDASDADTSVFFESVLKLADIYEGEVIALPVYVDGGLLYYRKDLLDARGIDGPPETWQQLVEYSLNVEEHVRSEDPEFYGFVWQGAQYEGLICNFIEFAGSNGGGIIADGDSLLIETQANIEAAQLMHDLVHRYKVSPPSTFTEMKEEEVRLFFQNGHALFERNWPYAWALHEAAGSKVGGKVGIAPLPHFDGGKSVSALGGWHVGVSRFSDMKEESRKLAWWIAGDYNVQKQLALELGWNPGRKDVYSDDEVKAKLPHLTHLKGVFENARARPSVPYYTQISEVLQNHLSAVLAGEVTAREGLSAAETESGAVMARYRAD
jgi:multiple sugar transport system substrate-binding protein